MKSQILKKVRFCSVLVLCCYLFSCGGSSSGDEKSESVKIMEEAAALGEFPEDAEPYETASFSVNGTAVGGTDNTRIDDTDDVNGDASIRLPNDLSRAGNDIVCFGLWLNGKMYKTEVADSFTDLLSLIPDQLGVLNIDAYLDQGVSDAIKIDDLPVFFAFYDNYLFFYWIDQARKEYRTPIVAVSCTKL